jgi:hypothetical protein
VIRLRVVQFLVAMGGLAAGFALVLGWADRGVVLQGGLCPGACIAAGLCLAVAATISRQLPASRAVRDAASGPARPGRLAAGLALAGLKAVTVGGLLAALSLSSFNPVLPEPEADVLLDPGKGVQEPLFADAILAELARLWNRHGDALRCDSPAIARLAEEAGRGRLDSEGLARELAKLSPLNARLAEAATRLRGRMYHRLYVISTREPTPDVHPWTVHPSHLECRWINVWPDRTPQGGDDRRVVVQSYQLSRDPAVRNFLSMTVNVPEGQPVPRLLVIDADGREVGPLAHSGAWGRNFAYRATFPAGRGIVSARLVDVPPGPRRLPKVNLDVAPFGPSKGPSCQVPIRLGPGLEPLASWPVLSRPEAETPAKRVDHDPAVTWVLGPISVGDHPRFAGAVVEVVAGDDGGKTDARLERTGAYDGTPLAEAFPTAGLEGWPDLGRGLNLGGTPLVRASLDDAEGSPVVVARDDPRWITVVVPPRAAWAGSGWFDAEHQQAAAQLMVVASSLARREGRPGPPPVQADLLVAREDDTRAPREGGPKRPTSPLWRQLVDGFCGRLDGRATETPTNSFKGATARLCFALLGALTVVSASASIVERLRRRPAWP